MAYDLKLPVAQANPSWFGAVSFYVEIPSLGIYNRFISQVELTGMPVNVYRRIEHALPSDVLTALRAQYTDLTLTIVLNVPANATGTYLLDNIRFLTCSPSDPMCSGAGGSGGGGGGGAGGTPPPGAIVPPTDDVGTLPGRFSVGPTATASYSIALWTPQGRNGMTPNLGLSYSSAGHDGVVGQGWVLSGASSIITRCGANSTRDERPIPASLTGPLCLDGQVLVRVSAPGAPKTEYRTQPDTFVKIVLEESDQDGPRRFTAYTPDGLVHSYGSATDPLLEVSADVSPWSVLDTSRNDNDVKPDLAAKKRTRLWWLRGSVSDRFDNKISFRFTNPVGTTGSQEPLLETIDYVAVNGSATRSIKFNYSTRPNPVVRYKLGLPFGMTKLLTSIDMRVASPGTQTLKTARFYKLVQSSSVTTTRPRLDSVQECDGSGASATCKRATTFTYQPGIDTVTSIWIPDMPEVSAIYTADVNADGRTDLVYRAVPPGGGANDPEHWFKRVAQGSGTSVSFGPAQDLNIAASPIPGDPIIGDWNYDGFSDIAVPTGGGAYTYFKNEGLTGGNFDQIAVDSPAPNAAVLIGDFGGRGKPAIFRPGTGPGSPWAYSYLKTTCVPLIPSGGGPPGTDCDTARSSVSGPLQVTFEANPLAGWNTFAVDIDSDGTLDVVSSGGGMTNHLVSMRQSTVPSAGAAASDWSAPVQTTLLTSKDDNLVKYVFLDQNGDGLKDALRFRQGHAVPDLVLNSGAGFAKPQPLSLGGTKGNVVVGSHANAKDITDVGVRILDYDRDGRDDVLLVDNGVVRDSLAQTKTPIRESMVVLLSRGTGFQVYPLDGQGGRPLVPLGVPADGFIAPDSPDVHNYKNTQVLDANGDGQADIFMYQWTGAVQVRGHVVTRHGNRADLLVSITDGMGKKTTVSYLPQSETAVYDHDPCMPSAPARCGVDGRRIRDYPQSEMNSTDHLLVASHTTDSGKGGVPNVVNYKYIGRIVDVAGGGPLGFTKWIVSDVASNTTTTETFDLDSTADIDDPAGNTTTVYMSVGMPTRREEKTVATGFTRTSVTSSFYQLATTHSGASYYRRLSFSISDSTEKPANGREENILHVSTFPHYDPALTDYGLVSAVVTSRSEHRVPSNLPIQTVDVWKATYDDPVSFFTGEWLIGRKNREVRCVTGPADGGLATIHNCDVPNPPTPITPSPARITTFVNDRATGRVLSTEIQPEGSADERLRIEYAAPAFGLVTTVTRTDPATNESRVDKIAYDAHFVHPKSFTNALNQTTTVSHDAALGVALSSTDPNGVATTMSYDTFGRLRRINAPGGAGETITYTRENDPDFSPSLGRFAMRVARLVDGGGDLQTLTNRHGQETRRQQKNFGGNYAFVQQDYDQQGRLDTFTRPSSSASQPGVATTITYDDVGRPLTVTRPEEAVNDSGANVTPVTSASSSFTYLPALDHMILTLTSETQKKVRQTTDSGGRLVVHEAQNDQGQWLATQYKYGDFGNLRFAVRTDASGQASSAKTVEYRYDILGRPIAVIDPAIGIRRTFYNPFGDIRETEDATTAVTKYNLDALGRVTQRKDADGDTIFKWDTAANGKGKIAETISSTAVTRQFFYTPVGQLLRQTWTLDGASYTIDYSYDPSDGKLLHLTYPSVPGAGRLVVTNTYDSASGRLTKVSNDTSGLAYWSLSSSELDGAMNREVFGNGVVTNYTHSPTTGRLQGLLTTKAGVANPIRSWGYAYLADGNLQRRSNLAPGGTAPAQHERFEYDKLDRLSRWIDADDDGDPLSGGWAVTYGFDDFGNMTSRNFAAGPSTGGTSQNLGFTVDSTNDQVTAGPWGEYEYDANGNQKTRFKSTADSETVTYTAFDLPKRIEGPRPATFGYDATGVRAKKVTGTKSTVSIAGLYEKRTSGSGSSATIDHVLSIIGPRGIVAQQTRREGTTMDVVRYLHADNLGSVDAVTDSTGAAIERTNRDPYGTPVSNFNQPVLPGTITASGNNVRLGFTGHEQDDELGLINMRGRVFDPRLARFLTPDPLAGISPAVDAYNRYAYVLNNPTKFTDPSGFIPCQADPSRDCTTFNERLPSPNMVNQLYPQNVGYVCATGTMGDGDYGCEIFMPTGYGTVLLDTGGGNTGSGSSVGGGGGAVVGGGGGSGNGGGDTPQGPPPPNRRRTEDCTKPCAGSQGGNLIQTVGGAVTTQDELARLESVDRPIQPTMAPWEVFSLGRAGVGLTMSLGKLATRSATRGALKLLPELKLGSEQLGKKLGKHTGDFGLNPANPAHRQQIVDKIRNIVDRYDDVRQGPWNPRGGGGTDYLFFRQCADVVVTKPGGDFVTILKGGVENGWFKDAGSLF